MRYILTIALFYSLLYSYEIESSYKFKEHKIYSEHLIEDINSSFLIVEIPDNINRYQLQSKKLLDIFKENGHEINISSPVVLFEKEIDIDFKEIKNHISYLYTKEYMGYDIKIESIEIEPTSYFDLDGYTIEYIDFSQNLLRRDRGTFYVDFKSTERDKRLFFRFKIDAHIEALVATKNIDTSTNLSYNNLKVERVKVGEFLSLPLKISIVGNHASKNYIREGDIITSRDTKKIFAIEKNSKVNAILKDGLVSIEIEATAMEAGSIGDTIRIRMNDRTYNQAVVINRGLVEIK